MCNSECIISEVSRGKRVPQYLAGVRWEGNAVRVTSWYSVCPNFTDGYYQHQDQVLQSFSGDSSLTTTVAREMLPSIVFHTPHFCTPYYTLLPTCHSLTSLPFYSNPFTPHT